MSSRSHTSAHGPSQRQLRVGEVLRRSLSEVLARGELHDPELDGVSITVSEVRASPDLRHATVFVLPLGGVATDEILEALERNGKELRHIVTKSVSLKYSPKLSFVADRSFDQMDRTRELLGSDEVRRDLERDADD